jgi:hypothetical protein
VHVVDKHCIIRVQGAAEDLRLSDRSATVVWSLATVHHWRDVAAVHRALSPGGRFLAVERRERRDAGLRDSRRGSRSEPRFRRRGESIDM